MPIPSVDYIWQDGELVAWEEAQVHVLTHALHYASGAFEGVRCYSTPQGPAVFRLVEHMERFLNSAKLLYMELPYSLEELCEAVKQTVSANKLEQCYIRPLVFRGYGSMGVDPLEAPVQVIIAVWPWDSYLGEEALATGVDVGISSWRQRSVNAFPPQVKATASYLNSGLAHIEAVRHGYNEAILLNEDGKVCEGSGENLFVVRGGAVITPPISDGVLAGITRDSVMTLAREAGYEVREESLVRSQLYTAEECFMSGTAAELVPVRSCDGIAIGSGAAGPVALGLQAAYFACVHGENPNHTAWLDHVN
ncbi:MAG: branched-chain amino acid transaminase [Coriobacteriia bacterium]|nr:branched-chain amino acid transaminase [Coriobacteriia bacterium]